MSDPGLSKHAVDEGTSAPPNPTWGALAAGLVVALGYLILRTSPELAPGAFADDGVYLAVGKGLAEGEGYRSLHASGAPVHQKYPPGLPALLAAFWRWGGELPRVVPLATGFSLLASAGAAALLWRSGRRDLRSAPVWLALFALGPFFLEGAVQYFNLPLSEPLFLLLVAGSIAAFPSAARGRWWGVLAVTLLVSAALLVRAQGVVLILALLLAYPWARASKGPGLVMAALPAVAAVLWSWLASTWRGTDSVVVEPDELAYASVLQAGSIGESISATVATLEATSLSYFASFPAHFASHRIVALLLVGGLAGVAVAGAVKAGRRHPFAVWSALLLTAVLFVWPYAQDRFLLMLLPLWGMLAAAACPPPRDLLRTWGGRAAMGAVVAGLAVVAVHQVGIRQAVQRPADDRTPYGHPAWFLRQNTDYLTTTADWLRDNAEPEDRVLAPLPQGLFLLTGLQGANATPFQAVGQRLFAEEGHYLAERIRDQQVTLLVLWGFDYAITHDVAGLQRICPDALLYQGTTAEPTQAIVFRIQHEDPCLVAWMERVL